MDDTNDVTQNSTEIDIDIVEHPVDESSFNNTGIPDGHVEATSNDENNILDFENDNIDIDDNIFNYLHDFADVSYLDNPSDNDDLETFVDGNLEGNIDDNLSIQVLLSDLENEYVDLLSEVTFSKNTDQKLSEAHEEIITILNEMKTEEPPTIKTTENSEKMNTNESNSTIEILTESVLNNTNKSYSNNLSIDSILYFLIVLLERNETEYYQISFFDQKNSFQKNKQLFIDYFFEQFIETNKTETVFKNESENSVYRLKIIEKKNLKYSSIFNLQNRLFEKILFHQSFNDKIFICLELSFCLDDYLNSFFDADKQNQFINEFYRNRNILQTIDESFFTVDNLQTNYFGESCRITYDILSGIIYLHNNNIIHNNLNLKTVYVTENGLIKIGGFFYDKNDWEKSKTESDNPELKIRMENISDKENVGRLLSFATDYYQLGNIITAVFIPGLNIFSYENFPKDILNELLICLNDSLLINNQNYWSLQVLYNENLNKFVETRFLNIGNEELGRFLHSFYLPDYKRCCNYTKPVVIRQLTKEFVENILSYDSLKTLSFYSDKNDWFSNRNYL